VVMWTKCNTTGVTAQAKAREWWESVRHRSEHRWQPDTERALTMVVRVLGMLIRLGFPIFRKVQITIDLGGFETHRSSFKSKEMNPATLAPRILWLSAELLLD
jgi:hypothetical protein